MPKLIYTKEPGTWVMFLIAFITGALKSDTAGIISVIVFISLSLLLMLKAPLSAFFKRRDKDAVPSILILSVPGLAGCLYSAFEQPPLILLYAAGFFLMIPYFIFLRKGFPVLSEACGMAVMGLSAVISASINREIYPNIYLGGMFFVFYFASSFRVRLSINRYRLAGIIYPALILLAGAVLIYTGHKWIYLSFLPLAEDIYAGVKNRREDFKRLGIISTVKAIIFAVILTVFQA